MLDGFLRNTRPGAVFLASFLPAAAPEEDYLGEEWVGTSHVSQVAGVIRHALTWIENACSRRGLRCTALAEIDCDSQYWLRIERKTGLTS